MSKRNRYGRSGIQSSKLALDIKKEFFRKSIHLCTLLVPVMLSVAYYPVIVLLCVITILYCVAEYLRFKGKEVPLFSVVTAAAARKRDENNFVLGPITLSLGVLLTALLFKSVPASIGIYSLGIGDGLASLAGKLFGRIAIPHTGGKTVAGSLTCFMAIFVVVAAVTGQAKVALCIAFVGMCIEMLPLKDFDNLLIPLVLAAIAQFCFGL